MSKEKADTMQNIGLEGIPAKEGFLSGFWESFRRFWSRLFSVRGSNQSNLQNSEPTSGTSSINSTNSSSELTRVIEGNLPMQIESPNSIRAEGSANVVVNRFDLSDRTLSALAFGVSMFALGLALLGLILGQISEREARLAQQDAMLLKAALIAHKVPVNEDQLHKDKDP